MTSSGRDENASGRVRPVNLMLSRFCRSAARAKAVMPRWSRRAALLATTVRHLTYRGLDGPYGGALQVQQAL